MSNENKGGLLNWALVVTIALGGVAAIVIVIVNTSATTAISAQAERSLLVADMQAAVQTESEAAALFVAHLPGMGTTEISTDEMPDTMGHSDDSVHHEEADPDDLSDHPEVVKASASFEAAANLALSLTESPVEAQRVRSALTAHEAFIDSMVRLNSATHAGTDAMSVYHADTLVAETDLLETVHELRAMSIAGLEDAVDRSEWSQGLLFVVLPIATVGALIAAVWLIFARRARQRVSFLENVISEKERFIGTVSHEIRTPLAAIVGFSELLATSEPDLSDNEKREYLATITAQGNEVSSIVDDLLVAARAEIGELTVVKVPVDLGAQIRQVVEAVDFPVPESIVADTSVIGLGDPGRVRQVIRNLLTNAMRHGGPNINIDIEAHDDTVTIRVMDDGDPIPPDAQGLIFEPYATLTDGRPVTGSIGLGLTVSRQLARLMDGDLRYVRSQGQSIFVFTLPIAAGDDRPAQAATGDDRLVDTAAPAPVSTRDPVQGSVHR